MTPDDLRSWRKRHGLNQSRAGAALGFSESAVSGWESGAHKIPQVAFNRASEIDAGMHAEELAAAKIKPNRFRPNQNKVKRSCRADTAAQRFADKFTPEPNSGCWLWEGSVDRRGYGYFDDGVERAAHRVSWRLHRGEIPEGLHVLHNCDNPYCVNPDHLRLGTHSENMHDTALRNRHRKGEFHQMGKLSDAATVEIRGSTEPAKVLAAKHDVSDSLIYMIRNNKIRTHLL